MSAASRRAFYALMAGVAIPPSPPPYLDDLLTLVGGTQLSWNFSEASGAPFEDGHPGNTAYDVGTVVGTPTYQVASGFRGDDYAVQLDSGDYFWDSDGAGANLAMSSILAMSEGFVLALIDTSSTGHIVALTRNVSGGRFIRFAIAADGYLILDIKTKESAALAYTIKSSAPMTAGKHLVMARKKANKWSLWIDGMERSGTTTSAGGGTATLWFSSMVAPVTRMAFGAFIRDTVTNLFTGSLARIVIGNTPPDDAMMARLGDAMEFAKVWDKWLINYNASESDVSYSADRRKVTAVAGTDKVVLARQLSKRSGKFYVEYLCHPSAAGVTVGAGLWLDTNITDRLGDGDSFALYQDGKFYRGGVGTNIGLPDLSGSSSDFVIQKAVDFDAQKIWYGLNGTWSGDPAAGTGQAWTSSLFPSYSPAFACAPIGVGSSVRIRSPDEFSYPVPDGFYAGIPG